jgi:hypothetical protein
MHGIKHVCQTRFRHIFNFMFSRRFSLRIPFLTKLMTCQNLQNKLLNITVVYLVSVGEFKKNVTRQTWRALFHFGKYLFQFTRHFGSKRINTLLRAALISYSSISLSSSSSTEVRKYRLLSFNARYKTCMSNPVPTHPWHFISVNRKK